MIDITVEEEDGEMRKSKRNTFLSLCNSQLLPGKFRWRQKREELEVKLEE